ncbi:cuticle protein 10.9-like [Parasteatoda tepidariorum]|uniref:cuticle protein 10.9-like n=1 Tax=Parasteatoda tepidariorum TaxID=114398 RepID=UPI00077F91E9|nr:cuticle protein 10.9-like [Parasteatoda tepidariorum]
MLSTIARALVLAALASVATPLPLTIPPRYIRMIEFTTPNVLETIEEQHRPYEFSFSVRDDLGTKQHRQEIANSEGVVKGSYGYLDPEGVYRFVDYTADGDGYRARLRNIKLAASSGASMSGKPIVLLTSGGKINASDYLSARNSSKLN